MLRCHQESILEPHIAPYTDTLERGWQHERTYLASVFNHYHALIPWCLPDYEEPLLPLPVYDPLGPPVLEELSAEDLVIQAKTISESDSDSALNSSCHSSDDDDTNEEWTGDAGNKRKHKRKKDGSKRKKQCRTAPSGKPAAKAKTSKCKTAMPTVTASPLASVTDDISLPSTSSTAMETSNNNTTSQSASSMTPKTAVASTNTM